jgi:hypothetical protein
MVIRAKLREELEKRIRIDRLPGTWSKLEMKLLNEIVDWARSTAGAIWRAIGPHATASVAGGAGADIVRSRRELVLENAMLRHQLAILRRKSPRPRFTTFDQEFRMFWRRRRPSRERGAPSRRENHQLDPGDGGQEPTGV